MKKFITLVLALALVLGLAAPAMAFTSDSTAAVKNPYELDIYLVEYDDNDFFGFVSLPKSDRGYAKNEIVAAVVELYVPKNETLDMAAFGSLVFGGDNVSLNVTDNKIGASNVAALSTTTNVHADVKAETKYVSADDEIVITIGDATATSPVENNIFVGKNTFKWLVFAKVTGDDASLYAKLVDGAGGSKFGTGTSMTLTLKNQLYTITKANMGTDNGTYTIAWTKGTPAVTKNIVLQVNKNNKTTGMTIDPGTGDDYALGVDVNKVLGVIDPANTGKFLDPKDAPAKDVLAVYDDIAVDVFGLDYMLIGNYLRDSFFEKLESVDTIIATVDIEPWTAYVTVPDEVIVTPPKTGDAASILGFVMVALSGAGAVALRKRG